eukprot:363371-Chlamydomonas_euryale.AAC.13
MWISNCTGGSAVHRAEQYRACDHAHAAGKQGSGGNGATAHPCTPTAACGERRGGKHRRVSCPTRHIRGPAHCAPAGVWHSGQQRGKCALEGG